MTERPVLPPRHRRAIIAAVMTSTFMAAIEVTVIATAMPSIIAKLGGFELYSWAFGIYLLAQGVLTPIFGRLSDLFGRRPVYAGSIGIFVIGSAMCGLAFSMPALIAARAIQGLGAAGIAPISATIIADITTPEERPRALSYISAIYGVAGLIGPLAGAFFVNTLGWPWVFWINVPIGVVSLLLILLFFRETPPARREKLDLLGSGLMLAAGGGLMLALTQYDQLRALPLGLLTLGGLLALGLLVVQQRRSQVPLLPHHLWRSPVLVIGDAFSLFSGAFMIAGTAFLPTYIQGVQGFGPLDAGITLGFSSVAWTLAVMLGAPIIGRFTVRLSAVFGAALMLAGSLGMVFLAPQQPMFWIRATSLLMGVGMGVATMIFTIAIQGSVQWQDRGRATSSFFFTRVIGQALGAAAFGGVLNAGLAGRLGKAATTVQDLMDPAQRHGLPPAVLARDAGLLDHALHQVYLGALVVAVITLLLTLLLPRNAGRLNAVAMVGVE